ncbi:MAG: GntR family transcriptional regulator [Ignavibacteria bacterium]|nr:GntR family transcriptional regulator [Ignavibacteria bacterium]
MEHEIATTNYRAGAHLKESQISAEFGKSVVPVREAFRDSSKAKAVIEIHLNREVL